MIALEEIKSRLRACPPIIPAEELGVPPADLPLRTEYPTPSKIKLARVVARAAALCPLPGPLCAWAVRREGHYFDGPGRTWGDAVIAYADARDMLCWMAGKREADL